MIDKLDEVERRYDRLEADLANPETLGDTARLTRVMKERSSLERLVSVYRAFKAVRGDLDEAERMLESADTEERGLGKEELPALREKCAS
ncbi:MAG TPA: PCRF domain-containing protein, partial [Myxococcaceae bacterium]|nr:PCRF domain-containing protein [Myxococcaceae bacterium]